MEVRGDMYESKAALKQLEHERNLLVRLTGNLGLDYILFYVEVEKPIVILLWLLACAMGLTGLRFHWT